MSDFPEYNPQPPSTATINRSRHQTARSNPRFRSTKSKKTVVQKFPEEPIQRSNDIYDEPEYLVEQKANLLAEIEEIKNEMNPLKAKLQMLQKKQDEDFQNSLLYRQKFDDDAEATNDHERRYVLSQELIQVQAEYQAVDDQYTFISSFFSKEAEHKIKSELVMQRQVFSIMKKEIEELNKKLQATYEQITDPRLTKNVERAIQIKEERKNLEKQMKELHKKEREIINNKGKNKKPKKSIQELEEELKNKEKQKKSLLLVRRRLERDLAYRDAENQQFEEEEMVYENAPYTTEVPNAEPEQQDNDDFDDFEESENESKKKKSSDDDFESDEKHESEKKKSDEDDFESEQKEKKSEHSDDDFESEQKQSEAKKSDDDFGSDDEKHESENKEKSDAKKSDDDFDSDDEKHESEHKKSEDDFESEQKQQSEEKKDEDDFGSEASRKEEKEASEKDDDFDKESTKQESEKKSDDDDFESESKQQKESSEKDDFESESKDQKQEETNNNTSQERLKLDKPGFSDDHFYTSFDNKEDEEKHECDKADDKSQQNDDFESDFGDSQKSQHQEPEPEPAPSETSISKQMDGLLHGLSQHDEFESSQAQELVPKQSEKTADDDDFEDDFDE